MGSNPTLPAILDGWARGLCQRFAKAPGHESVLRKFESFTVRQFAAQSVIGLQKPINRTAACLGQPIQHTARKRPWESRLAETTPKEKI